MPASPLWRASFKRVAGKANRENTAKDLALGITEVDVVNIAFRQVYGVRFKGEESLFIARGLALIEMKNLSA